MWLRVPGSGPALQEVRKQLVTLHPQSRAESNALMHNTSAQAAFSTHNPESPAKSIVPPTVGKSAHLN